MSVTAPAPLPIAGRLHILTTPALRHCSLRQHLLVSLSSFAAFLSLLLLLCLQQGGSTSQRHQACVVAHSDCITWSVYQSLKLAGDCSFSSSFAHSSAAPHPCRSAPAPLRLPPFIGLSIMPWNSPVTAFSCSCAYSRVAPSPCGLAPAPLRQPRPPCSKHTAALDYCSVSHIMHLQHAPAGAVLSIKPWYPSLTAPACVPTAGRLHIHAVWLQHLCVCLHHLVCLSSFVACLLLLLLVLVCLQQGGSISMRSGASTSASAPPSWARVSMTHKVAATITQSVDQCEYDGWLAVTGCCCGHEWT